MEELALVVSVLAFIASIAVPLILHTRVERRISARIRGEERIERSYEAMLVHVHTELLPSLKRLRDNTDDAGSDSFAEQVRTAFAPLVPHAAQIPDKEFQALFYGVDWAITHGMVSARSASHVRDTEALVLKLFHMLRARLGGEPAYSLSPSFDSHDYDRRHKTIHPQ